MQDMETSRYLGQDIIDTLGILCRTYVINTSIYLVQDIIDTSRYLVQNIIDTSSYLAQDIIDTSRYLVQDTSRYLARMLAADVLTG